MRSSTASAPPPTLGPNPFEPLTLRGLTLENRFIKAATHDGASFDELARSYRRLARNGVPLITVAYVAVSPVNKTFDHQHHIDASNQEQWAQLVSRVGAVGGRMAAQLHHPGLFCMSTSGRPLGPSFCILPSKLAWPHVMSADDIATVKAEFVAAATRCVAAGFAAIELHCGHGCAELSHAPPGL